jgi:hypothetical protein
MKPRYRLFKRGKYYYSEDANSRQQHSLHTGDQTEAQRLIAAKNEAINNAQFTLAIGQTYLAVTDAEILTRTWNEVMNVISARGGESTKDRCVRALRMASFDKIRRKAILQTTSADFLSVLADGKQSTRHYLRLLHSAAMDLGCPLMPFWNIVLNSFQLGKRLLLQLSFPVKMKINCSNGKEIVGMSTFFINSIQDLAILEKTN